MSSADALIYNPVEPCRKSGRSLSTCGPTSSYEALRYAVAALNRLDDFYCEKIGAGFFSEVFKVRHRVTGQVMVLKMNTSQSNRANSLREVQLMNRLAHHNILKFMGVCVHEGQLHALTEFINGGSLEQLLQDRTRIDLSWERRIKLSLDISCGMEYLHSRGVFHRDLTSKNVLIKIQAEEMTAVVGDFGLAEKIPDPRDCQRLPIVGSPYWMAPECLKGKWYNEKADVFSYGIILCEIIAKIEADPDVLPRTENFGVDYVAFSEMCPECPPQFLELAFSSCRIDPDCRPNFKEIVCQLEKLLNVISSMSGGLHLSYVPVANASCCDDGDSIDNVRAIFAHGWTRSNVSQSKTELKTQSPEKNSDILQMSPSVPVTPKHIGEAMSMQDPHYKPNNSSQNPFATLPRFWKGKKFLEQSASFTNIDLCYSFNFNLPSPYRPTPIANNIDSLDLNTKYKKVSKSLPTSPILHKKDIFENSLVIPRSISPGPSFSPPSSLSPFEADESFSGYSSVQEQMSDCKLEDSNFCQKNKINCNSTCNVPIMVNLDTKTPPFCIKLRRSSGESGFFSAGDRNSTCDLLLEQINDTKVEDALCQAECNKSPNLTDVTFTAKSSLGAKLRRSSGESGFFSVEDPSSACDLSLESCHNSEDLSSWTSDNIIDLQPNLFFTTADGRRRKRPSSCCSDDICSCCRGLPHNSQHERSLNLLEEHISKTVSSNSLLPNLETNLEEVDYDCHMYDSLGSNNLMEPLRQKEISSQIKSDTELSCTNFSLSKTCKKGNRLAKCMRTSPDL